MWGPSNWVPTLGVANSANPDGTDSDLETNSATAPVSSDYTIIATGNKKVALSVADAGFMGTSFGIRLTTAFDAEMQLTIEASWGPSSNKGLGGTTRIYQFTVAAGSFERTFSAGAESSVGGSAQHIQSTALEHAPLFIVVTWAATGSAPTVGTWRWDYSRF